jgi:glycosyltransferase 2 family protein
LKNKQLIGGLVVLVALVAIVIWCRDRIHFDFGEFRSQLALADWYRIGIGAACIYVGYVFRSLRWALLLRHNKKVHPFSLLGTQVIGFTAVALIGRIADPVRPYLVAKKTGLSLSNQIAVYIVERLFDFGSMALIFSLAMLWIPDSEVLKATSHSPIFSTWMQSSPVSPAIIARYGGLVITLLAALFLVAVRLASGVVATIIERSFGIFSRKLGQAAAHKVHAFHSGLDTIRNFSDFAITTGLSLSMWVLIMLAYLETTTAFTASRELASITVPECVLLMTASGGASIFQLPIIGWFSQIGIVAAVLSGFFHAAWEPALACAATILLVTFLDIIPVGLVWAQFEHISLRKIAVESEHASEEIAADEPTAHEAEG